MIFMAKVAKFMVLATAGFFTATMSMSLVKQAKGLINTKTEKEKE